MMRNRLIIVICAILLLSTIGAGTYWGAETVAHLDASDSAGGRTERDFPQVASDVFRQMDNGLQLNEDEVKGRNTWILWTAGNEQFWDRMSRESFGIVDLLKTIDSRNHDSRFRDM